MKYGYVKYRTNLQKVIYGIKNKYGMSLKNLGMGEVWVKIFFENEVWVREQTAEEVYKVQNSNL